MQLSLSFVQDLIQQSSTWSRLSDAEQRQALEVLARLIAKAAVPQPSVEQDHDRSE
jgi:hypothetical protein